MSTPEIGFYPDATPDEQIAYEMGWNTATAIARTKAFAAIRRAAEIAREHDNYATQGGLEIERAERYRGSARQIRRDIREVIGSEKA